MSTFLHEEIETFFDRNNMWNFEGVRGVENLKMTINTLGYSSLEDFLEDNPGAIEAILEWISNQNVREWAERLTR